jgi:hypothetical protein
MSPAQLEALKVKLALSGNAQSKEELVKILKDSSKDFYQLGASWNGLSTEAVLIGLAIAGLVGYVLWFNANYECVATSERWECDTTSTAVSGGTQTRTSCGWKSYCSLYKEKK